MTENGLAMGGTSDRLDNRMRGIFTMLEGVDLQGCKTALDIGVGSGQIAAFLAARGISVTGIGLAIDQYNFVEGARRPEVRIIEASVEQIPCESGSMDLVVMSHVLEHCQNVDIALKEAIRVLSPAGRLLIFVPPHELLVVSGHVSIGWSVGQLAYVLALQGMDLRNAQFLTYAGSVACLCRRSAAGLPEGLIFDTGDLTKLVNEKIFPVPFSGDCFMGTYGAVNWPNGERILRSEPGAPRRILRAFFRPFVALLPRSLREKAARFLHASASELLLDTHNSV